MSQLPVAPFRAVLNRSLSDLLNTLREAEDYLGGGNDLAAIGTLDILDHQVADLKAAIRLYTRSRRGL
jgi:hypothetical protein